MATVSYERLLREQGLGAGPACEVSHREAGRTPFGPRRQVVSLEERECRAGLRESVDLARRVRTVLGAASSSWRNGTVGFEGLACRGSTVLYRLPKANAGPFTPGWFRAYGAGEGGDGCALGLTSGARRKQKAQTLSPANQMMCSTRRGS